MSSIHICRWDAYLTELGQSELHPPDLRLASQTELSAKLQLLVQALLLERPAGGLDRRPVCRAGKEGESGDQIMRAAASRMARYTRNTYSSG